MITTSARTSDALLRAMPGKPPFNNGAYCYTHIGIYESTYLNRLAVYSLPPVTVQGAAYAQRGLFVFHTANGVGRIMLSRPHGMPKPSPESR